MEFGVMRQRKVEDSYVHHTSPWKQTLNRKVFP